MCEMQTIQTAVGECRLRRTKRRTLAISVHPDGTVELVAPLSAALDAILAKVAKRTRWITIQRHSFSEMNRHRLPLRYVSGASHRYLGRQYRLKVQKGDSTGVRLVGGYFLVSAKSGRPDRRGGNLVGVLVSGTGSGAVRAPTSKMGRVVPRQEFA